MTSKNDQMTEVGYSPDAQAQRQEELLALLRQIAPEVVSDNQIDMERLKELLGQECMAPAEHYELNWAGKSAARREIQKTTSNTLLPAANNPANAPHMLIEGENLEVLRVLQKSYYGKVKMIYIDPPYNTGNDSFVYPDEYSETLAEYQKRTGEKSEAGFLNKQSLWKKNSKENGQFHSVWLSMMYPRLYLARNLLLDDGIIAIQIDDNELSNLIKICDEIFGEENFISTVIVKMSHLSGMKMSHASKKLPKIKEFIVLYAKSKEKILLNKVMIPCAWDEAFDRYSRVISNADESIENWKFSPIGDYLKKIPEESHDEWKIKNAKRIFRTAVNDAIENIKDGIFREIKTATGLSKISLNGEEVLLASDKLSVVDGILTPTLTIGDIWTDIGINNLHNEGGVDFANGKKPLKLINRLLRLLGSESKSEIILDFFAGSGTTAQAVMELNIEDSGNRQCICVQMPEVLEETSEAYKAGYRTIADITRARIEKVIAKLKKEYPDKTTDLACANFTLAPSNFKVWRSDITDEAALRDQLAMFQSVEKSGATSKALDAQTAMLTEVLLKHGLGALSVHAISKPKQIAGVTVHRVLMQDDRQLWLCFEPYTENLKDEIVKAKPAQVVLLNSCFVGDKADELLSNLQLELAGLDIGLLVI